MANVSKKNRKVLTAFRKYFSKTLFSPLKFILKAAFLPFYLIFNSFRFKPIWKRTALFLFSLFVLLPVWVGGFFLAGKIVQSALGYSSQNINIVGTGSMYPTWPKGTAGKDPKELAREIVSNAGFLPYPNGIVINGKRYFDYKIQKSDIVTAQNEAIDKSTEETYGTPSGIVKRVIAMGGDTVELRDGVVYLNGQPQKEPYTAKPYSTFGEDFLHECQKYTVPSDSVFLMGDNRKGSGDSREFGPVKYTEINRVLPLYKQRDTLDKNWRDASNDLAPSSKPKIDKNRFIELLNEKRKEEGVSPIKHEPELDVSAKIRGQYLLTHNAFQKEASYNDIIKAMTTAGYWNSYVWEWRIEGYYSAEELIEDYLTRDSSDAKNVWYDKKFDDIGIAEVSGTLNGCPTQIVVVHAAGYIPPNYKQSDIDSWQQTLDNLKEVLPSWEIIKNYPSTYAQNKADVDRMLEIINTRISRIESIVSTMKANKWLSNEQETWIKEEPNLYSEEESLARKLNSIQWQ